MSVAVDSLDQSSICLDNVLRINPKNIEAAGALYRIRIPEMEMEQAAFAAALVQAISRLTAMWFVIAVLLIAAFATITSLST